MNNNTHEKLGNYRLVQRLGAGGFSQVYLGEHLYLKTPAAIKVLHPRLFDDQSLNDFLTEARIVAQLDHPHIVRMLEFGVEDAIPYLVLQYASNGTVRQRYPKGTRIPLSIIIQYVEQIAEALQYAHELKIIHRDIKPENFLLDKNDEILLGDFGLAIPSQSSIGMSDHERAGTTVYMAPEQSRGKSSRASDQYALGIVVYEWLCGYPPFRGNEYEILHQHIYEPPLPLHEVVPAVPAAIEQAVMRALAKEPSERFPRIQDFPQALKAAYHQSQSRQASAAGQEALANSTSDVLLIPSPENDVEEPIADRQSANPGFSSTLNSSPSKQGAMATSSQDQSQTYIADQLPLTDEAQQRDDAENAQQREHCSFSTIFSPPSVFPEEQAAAHLFARSRWPAAVSSAKQRRISRRTAVAAGMLGLAVLGGAGALYLFDSQNLGLTPAFSHTLARSTARSRSNGTAQAGTGGTKNTPGTGHDGPGSSSSQNKPPSTKKNPQSGQSGGAGTQPTTPSGSQSGGAGATTPLTVQIDNGGALAQVNTNSSTSVSVTASQADIPATVNVTYSNNTSQNLGTQTTDGNGNATFAWSVRTTGLGNLLSLSATLVASATDANRQTASSAPVTVTVLLNVGGLGL